VGGVRASCDGRMATGDVVGGVVLASGGRMASSVAMASGVGRQASAVAAPSGGHGGVGILAVAAASWSRAASGFCRSGRRRGVGRRRLQRPGRLESVRVRVCCLAAWSAGVRRRRPGACAAGVWG
jgi:hypothetical protein